MKIRIKFAKHGVMKFIGHLDIMRYFQKAMRRADIDIAYSGGFSPHQIMSFASPLGVGVTSDGEYMDIEVNSTYSSAEAVKRLNAVMVDGMQVLSYRKLPDNSKTAMALIAAADYEIRLLENHALYNSDMTALLADFYERESIPVVKKTKKSETELDIRPFIYHLEANGNKLTMQLAAGSVQNLKPELVLDAITSFAGKEQIPFSYEIHRLEMYEDKGSEEERNLVPLEKSGEEIGP